MFPSSLPRFALKMKEMEWKVRKGMESFETGPKGLVKWRNLQDPMSLKRTDLWLCHPGCQLELLTWFSVSELWGGRRWICLKVKYVQYKSWNRVKTPFWYFLEGYGSGWAFVFSRLWLVGVCMWCGWSLKHHWVLDMISYGPETMFLSLVGNMNLGTWYGIFRMWTAILMFLSTWLVWNF